MKLTLAKAGIIGLGAFVLYKIFSKASVAQGLEFKIGRVGYSFANNGFLLTFFIVVKNARKDQLMIDSIDAKVIFDNEQIGRIDNDLKILIPSQGEVTLPIAVNLFFLPVVNKITELITGKISGASIFEINGFANVEGLRFPVELKYTLA